MKMKTKYLSAALMLIVGSKALAASFVVNTDVDLPDSNLGDGVCGTTLGPNICSLRAAVMQANALPPGPHSILLAPGVEYRLTRSQNFEDDNSQTGDLDIKVELLIINPAGINGDGARSIVNGLNNDRVFDIAGQNDVTLQGFDIINGEPVQSEIGGAIVGRSGSQGAKIILKNMRIYENYAQLQGGAVYTARPLHMQYTEIFENEAQAGSAIYALGMDNANSITIESSSIYSNLGPLTTLITNTTAVQVKLVNSTISSNEGFGINTQVTNGAGTHMEVLNSTIANNEYGLVLTNSGDTLKLMNSVISTNGTDCLFAPGITIEQNLSNIFSDVSCPLPASNIRTNPLLTPLKRRSGGDFKVAVHWPRPDSAAINTGSAASDPQLKCEPIDPLGIARPQFFKGSGSAGNTNRCDRGAAEVPEDAIFYDSHEYL